MVDNVSYMLLWSTQNRASSSVIASVVTSHHAPSPTTGAVSRSTSPFDAAASWSILRHTTAAVTNKCASAANGMSIAYEPLTASALCGPTGKLPEIDLRDPIQDGVDKLQLAEPGPPGFDFTSWSLATNAWIRQKAMDALFPHQRLVFTKDTASLNSRYESVF